MNILSSINEQITFENKFLQKECLVFLKKTNN